MPQNSPHARDAHDPGDPSPGGDPAPTSAPAVLRVAVGVLLLEAVALAAAATWAVVTGVTGGASSLGLTVGVVVVAGGVAAVLVLAGRALLAARRWGRAPALTWQLLQLAVAVPALVASVQPVPGALAVASVVVVVGLFHPATVRWTTVGGAPRTF